MIRCSQYMSVYVPATRQLLFCFYPEKTTEETEETEPKLYEYIFNNLLPTSFLEKYTRISLVFRFFAAAAAALFFACCVPSFNVLSFSIY